MVSACKEILIVIMTILWISMFEVDFESLTQLVHIPALLLSFLLAFTVYMIIEMESDEDESDA